MQGFKYPDEPHLRKHAPGGYGDYESYRPWLRDEFVFRCVYCLQRERWNSHEVSFHIDHFVPVSVAPDLECEYSNLVYACCRCNSAKSNILGIPDPCKVGYAKCLEIQMSGNVDPLDDNGLKICESLKLNSPSRVEIRGRWIKILLALKEADPSLYVECMGFPTDLPDLRPPRTRAPENGKPDSVNQCFFVQRESGVLPEVY